MNDRSIDSDDLIKVEVLRVLLEGEKRYTEIRKEVWPRIEKDVGNLISEGSFHVILVRRLRSLIDEGLVRKKIVSPKNVRYSIEDGEARERAEMIVYMSTKEMRRSIYELLEIDLERSYYHLLRGERYVAIFNLLPFMNTVRSLLFMYLMIFWMKLSEAVINKDESSVNIYKKEIKDFVAEYFDAAVDLFCQKEESRFEARYWARAIHEILKLQSNADLIHLDMQGPLLFTSPSKKTLTQALRIKTEAMKAYYGEKSLEDDERAKLISFGKVSEEEFQRVLQTEEQQAETRDRIMRSMIAMLEKALFHATEKE